MSWLTLEIINKFYLSKTIFHDILISDTSMWCYHQSASTLGGNYRQNAELTAEPCQAIKTALSISRAENGDGNSTTPKYLNKSCTDYQNN